MPAKGVQIPTELVATLKAENIEKELNRSMGTAVRKVDALHSKLLASTMMRAHKKRMALMGKETAKLRAQQDEIDKLRMVDRKKMSDEERKAHLHQLRDAKIRHKEQLRMVEQLGEKARKEQEAAIEAGELLAEKKKAVGGATKRGVEYLGGGAGAGAVQAFEGAAEMGKAMKGVTAGMGKMAVAATVAAGAFAAIGGLVAAFMAIEGHAKGLNKELLGIGGFNMAGPIKGMDKFGDASAIAMARLSQLRNYASDIQRNFQLGMTEDQWAGVVDEMQSANIALDDMLKTIPAVNAEFGTSANLLAINVIAAKTLGVSTGDVAQAMGAWLKDGNLSMETMLDSLGQVAQDAQESGIDVRKFFGVVTQTTAELGLFGGRIEEISSAFKILTKRLGEKEAERALQNMNEFLGKNNDEMRLRMTLMAGTKNAQNALTKSALRQFEEMDRSGKAMEALKDALGGTYNTQKQYNELTKMSRKEFNAFTADLAKKGVDDKVIRDMMKVYDVGTAKGAAQVANALAQADLTAQMEVAFTGIEKMFGPIQNLTGINAMAAKQALGMSEEQLQQMRQFDNTVQTRIGALASIQRDSTLTAAQKQDQMIKFLQENGITSQQEQQNIISKLEAGETSTAAYLGDLLNTTEREGMESLSQAKTLAEKQAEATTTMADKLGQIAGWLMNTLWNGLIKWFGSKEDKAALEALNKSNAVQAQIDQKNYELQKAANDYEKNRAQGELMLLEEHKAKIDAVRDAVSTGSMSQEEAAKALHDLRSSPVFEGKVGDVSQEASMKFWDEAKRELGATGYTQEVVDLAKEMVAQERGAGRKGAAALGKAEATTQELGLQTQSMDALQTIAGLQEQLAEILVPGMDAQVKDAVALQMIEDTMKREGIAFNKDDSMKLAQYIAKESAKAEAMGVLGTKFSPDEIGKVFSGEMTDLSRLTAEEFSAVTKAMGAAGYSKRVGGLVGPAKTEPKPPENDFALATAGWVKGSAGDVLVKADELAGGRGTAAGGLLPEVVGAAARAGGAGGAGGGTTYNVTFIGTPREMENKMRQIILDHQRRTT